MGLGSGGLSWSTSGLLLPVVQMLLLTVGTLGRGHFSQIWCLICKVGWAICPWPYWVFG